jgi:hypothetical protein
VGGGQKEKRFAFIAHCPLPSAHCLVFSKFSDKSKNLDMAAPQDLCLSLY